MSIIPFCIYHYINKATNTYMGYIGSPQKIILSNGEEIYNCSPTAPRFNKWYIASIFYAVNPSIRPIPVGMRVFCAKQSTEAPYGTSDVTAVFDPFNIKKNCVYFTTFNQPVPNTEKLYFHKYGDNIFPSFDKNPPFEDPAWTQTQISPIFVMTQNTVGPNPTKINFRCVIGKCLPWVENIPDIYDPEPQDQLFNLENCMSFCNDFVQKTNDGRLFGMLDLIDKTDDLHMGKHNSFYSFYSFCLIGLLGSISLLVVILVLLSLQRRR